MFKPNNISTKILTTYISYELRAFVALAKTGADTIEKTFYKKDLRGFSTHSYFTKTKRKKTCLCGLDDSRVRVACTPIFMIRFLNRFLKNYLGCVVSDFYKTNVFFTSRAIYVV